MSDHAFHFQALNVQLSCSVFSLSGDLLRENMQELTVHHKDHNHDNNPPDGSNWELLCLYCHDNEHQRYLENSGNAGSGEQISKVSSTTYKPFAELKSILKEKK